MKKTWIIMGAIALVLLIFVGGAVSSYNNLVSLEQNVTKAKSNIDVQLERRNALIGNLVETVKGYASHESAVFKNVSDARAKLAGAKTVTEQDRANSELSSAVSRLLMVAENYPNLKADTQFTGLRDELAGTENRIAVVRRDYNEAATTFNTKIKSFPTVIIAGMFGFHEKDLYKASAGAEKTPQVKF